MPALQPLHSSLVKCRSYRYATLWEITRTDAVVKRYTNHNADIDMDDGGDVYKPSESNLPSAAQRLDSLRGANAEYQGVIAAADITDADLYAGKYSKATLLEHLVDWRYPYLGVISTNYWYILSVEFDGSSWFAQIGSLAHRTRAMVGARATRTCGHVLGEGRASGPGFCTVDIDVEGTYRWTGVDGDVVTNRGSFRLDSTDLDIKFSGTQADGWFDFGFLEWTTGLNSGLKADIVSSLLNSSVKQDIKIFQDMPHDVQIGDLATIYVGCDRLPATCKTKFDNLLQFGGLHFMPGFKKSISADSRTGR